MGFDEDAEDFDDGECLGISYKRRRSGSQSLQFQRVYRRTQLEVQSHGSTQVRIRQISSVLRGEPMDGHAIASM